MKKKKILLLEDNPIHREVILDGLEDAGYEVEKANNQVAADEILDYGFVPDLFVLDIVIETMKRGGIQFAEKIRSNPKYESIPVLFISVHLDELNKEKYFPRGTNENLLQKPFDFNDLLGKIREVLKD